ncbi:DUF302 domain-containing protein [Jeotgalibacillus campisalis]|uniref:DUF302 domain-containing protein n=1 Tax=Jeotgalibacillus campisalis TaxID=220754 RepID=A0A0C2VYV9_9BACL|nr:DUF302 domain-containing protein [Jeotgalibacillus campisalis]KIL49138.1 hypothetical protein KR50_11730 [Jeotgalibacillus campisalis]
MFHYTVETNQNISEAIQSLEQQLSEEQFGVLWQFDLQGKLQEKGLDFNQPYHVLEVCNPKEAKSVLEENLLAGYFLPCKIVVYEEEGKTKIGMPKPSALVSMLEDEEVKKMAASIENRLIMCMNKAVA